MFGLEMGEGDRLDEGFRPWEAFQEERRLSLEGQREMILALDRSLLTLSAGAIGLSLVLLQAFTQFTLTFLLVGAWIAFVVSIFAVLQSFRSSQGHLEAHREALSGVYVQKKEPDLAATDPEKATKLQKFINDALDRRERLVKSTERWNAWSFWSFWAGVVALLAFTFVNLPNLERPMSEKQEQAVQSGNHEQAVAPEAPFKKGHGPQDFHPELMPDTHPPVASESVGAEPEAPDSGGTDAQATPDTPGADESGS